jgi:hypothetical protein
MEILRHKTKWYKVHPKAYEPEKQTTQVAWSQIKQPGMTLEEIYRKNFEKQREDSRILYPSFRKDDK